MGKMALRGLQVDPIHPDEPDCFVVHKNGEAHKFRYARLA